MATLTSDDFSAQMIAQLRVLDPSISAEVGTPERKIIDTVAEALSQNQVDLTGLSGALDVQSKYGSNLDQFTALFGFARQTAQAATGYVVFNCTNAAVTQISVPAGTTIQTTQVNSSGQYPQYYTTAGGLIPSGATASGSVPVTCAVTGSQGNSPAGTLTQLVGNIVLGVTSVTNGAPISGGTDAESDNQYKARFQNTVFRNMAGTDDQYLATAVSTAYTTIANVVGPQSKYQEYIQVPDYDDAGFLQGVQIATTVSGNQAITGTNYTLTVASTTPFPGSGVLYLSSISVPITYTGKTGTTFTGCNGGIGQTATNAAIVIYGGGSGVQGQWTTALSSIPYAQDIYINPPPFVSNGQTGVNLSYFYRQGTDFNYNYPPLISGDAFRESQVSSTVAPNFTFLNVFNPSTGTAASGLQALSPGSVMLSEFRYLSTASRNSIKNNVQNAVDVFINGSNPTQTATTFLPAQTTFNTNSNNSMFIENFRRDGEPNQRPHPGNYFTPLYQTPLTGLPSIITIGTTNYYLGFHYWLVHDISQQGGSIRSRDGIEWSNAIGGDAGSQAPPGWPTPSPLNYEQPYTTPTGSTFNTIASTNTQVTVNDYYYDSNITVLQGSMETVRQITTDVLVHSARTRYFKVDVTVVYSSNANPAVTNAAISTALSAYFQRQFFGTIIRLADLLDLIYQVPGVQNVRWSNDLPTVLNEIRVIETDAYGNPLHSPVVDRLVYGTGAITELQRLYIYGNPNTSTTQNNFGTNDTFALTWSDPSIPGGNGFTATIPYNPTIGASTWAANIQTIIRAAASAATAGTLYTGISVSQDTWNVNSAYPMTSFTLTYGAVGTPYVPSVTPSVTQSTFDFDSDFFLRDNELPAIPTIAGTGDTVAGAIIRPRAQNVWVRPGIG